MRLLHLSWSWLNEICDALSAAAYSFTGMFTRPKEMVPEPIARAAMTA
jgi:hypothetical protein